MLRGINCIRKDSKAESMKERIQWVDCAKGIAIILVIYGHCVKAANSDAELIARGVIFLFTCRCFSFSRV